MTEVYKLVKKYYNGYWCSCCRHTDHESDVVFGPLSDIIEEFPKNYKDWSENFDSGYAPFIVRVSDPDDNEVASWEIYQSSYKTKMQKMKWLKTVVDGKEKIEIYLGDELFSGTLEEAHLVQKANHLEKELAKKESELNRIREQINKIDPKVTEPYRNLGKTSGEKINAS